MALPHIASPPLAPTGMREDKFTTHDGAIWPVQRHLMQNVNAIRKRMAEDVSDILNDRGAEASIDQDDLKRLGWSIGQVLAHGSLAIRTATAET